MKIQIITPSVPNFIAVSVNGKNTSHPLTEFTDDELDEVAKQWRFKLYENRDRQKRNDVQPVNSAQSQEE